MTTVYERITEKYGERGIHYSLVEAGHVGQNVYLLAEEMKLGCCAVGQLHEKDIYTLLDINPYKEAVVYYLVLGMKN